MHCCSDGVDGVMYGRLGARYIWDAVDWMVACAGGSEERRRGREAETERGRERHWLRSASEHSSSKPATASTSPPSAALSAYQ